MKRNIFYIITVLMSLTLLTSCYDDQDGNDFDSVMPDVLIVIPETAYSGGLGQTITIDPQITTNIPESDLEYYWEVQGNRSNDYGRGFYTSLVDMDKQGKTLNYTCKLDSNITSLNKSYKCRLRAHQKSTGRDFYSAAGFTLTIQGLSGLMILYSDGGSSDVGILMAEEFMPAANSIPENPEVTNALYSSINGAKIAGVGKTIVQSVPSSIGWLKEEAKNNCRILVQTTESTVWLNRNDLSLYGDWNAVFYLQGDRKVNAGNPKGYFHDGSNGYAFDGDDVFIYNPTQQSQYLFATYTPETECNGNCFTFAPLVCDVSTSGIQRLFYANSVNGEKTRKGFVAHSNGMFNDAPMYTKLLDTATDAVPFNPGDMKADAVKLFTDQRTHTVGVMKGDAGHPSFAGKYFFVDIFTKAETAGVSGMQNFPVAILDMSQLTSVNDAIAFDFGTTQNMYYYATPSVVYHYGLDGNVLTSAQPLCMVDGSALPINGEVTMMKMLRFAGVTTHNTDEVLVVATWDGAKSHLYALHLDSMTGNVTRVSTYDSSTTEGWNIGKIGDIYIKGL